MRLGRLGSLLANGGLFVAADELTLQSGNPLLVRSVAISFERQRVLDTYPWRPGYWLRPAIVGAKAETDGGGHGDET